MQESKAAGNSTPSISSDHGYSIQSKSSTQVDSDGNILASTWHSPLTYVKEVDEKARAPGLHDSQSALTTMKNPPPDHAYIAKCLAKFIYETTIKQEGELKAKELAEAFLDAPDLPPVTKHSLSELNIENVVTNINLRHDINFNHDLSFRPNSDGLEGSGKKSLTNKYYTALVAEIRLYSHLFQERSFPQFLLGNRKDTAYYVQRRLPIMFRTICDILKSLIPHRDHIQVDEVLDVSVLMQAIEHGIFDIVRLGEWIAELLKEHCAPMRDVMVDSWLNFIKNGVRKQIVDRSELIVHGLRELLGILEAMKLVRVHPNYSSTTINLPQDVANHQIRNLKTLLIDDTLNFERQYHADRLVNFQPEVNIDAARTWYAEAIDDSGLQQSLRYPNHDPQNFKLEIFTRAVVATLLGTNSRSFPETFHLDSSRLCRLKAEIDNLVLLEICTDMFVILIRQSGGYDYKALDVKQLQTFIAATTSDTGDCSPQTWMANSEALSLEILRQASHVAGQESTHSSNYLESVNQQLQQTFSHRSGYYATRIENQLLPQILHNVERHANSSPVDLFINLVSNPRQVPQPLLSLRHSSTLDSAAHLRPHTEPARLMNLTNRITHIILLHWRTWYAIAYTQNKSLLQPELEDSTASVQRQQRHSNLPPLHSSEETLKVMTTMNTSELPDTSQETHVARQTHSQ